MIPESLVFQGQRSGHHKRWWRHAPKPVFDMCAGRDMPDLGDERAIAIQNDRCRRWASQRCIRGHVLRPRQQNAAEGQSKKAENAPICRQPPIPRQMRPLPPAGKVPPPTPPARYRCPESSRAAGCANLQCHEQNFATRKTLRHRRNAESWAARLAARTVWHPRWPSRAPGSTAPSRRRAAYARRYWCDPPG